jgi:hypothetical protein
VGFERFLMLRPVRMTAICLALALLYAPLPVQAETPARQHLFHIERSKNANIVQYDAQVGADGKLFKKEPVVGYWIRLAEQGQVKELSWVQRTFAFGFDTKLDKSRESAGLRMKANVGRKINIVRNGDGYRATVIIDGALSYFEKMFIDASRKGFSLTVRYVELYGEDIQTGEARYEKFVP